MAAMNCIFLFVLCTTSRMVLAQREIIDYRNGQVIFFTGPTYKDRETYLIDEAAEALRMNPKFDKKLTTLFIPDYYEPQISTTHYTVDAYLERHYENFLQIDWNTPMVENKTDAKQPDVQNLTPIIADFILGLWNYTERTNFRLLTYARGCELGANVAHQIVNSTYGKLQLARMSALDPPKNFTIMGVPVTSNITEHVVDFSDVIHTSTDRDGTLIRFGHVDFWPNGGNAQPGCEETEDDDCSQKRSWAYWDESVRKQNGNGKQFCAYKSTSYEDYKKGVILSKPTFMGIDADTHIYGDYFLDVNPSYPFAQGCIFFHANFAPSIKHSKAHDNKHFHFG